jgi:hypothetical protein
MHGSVIDVVLWVLFRPRGCVTVRSGLLMLRGVTLIDERRVC